MSEAATELMNPGILGPSENRPICLLVPEVSPLEIVIPPPPPPHTHYLIVSFGYTSSKQIYYHCKVQIFKNQIYLQSL